MKQNKGITLIALVITIIVLLILAGVTIAMLSGQNGILNRASEAKYDNIISSVDEQAKVAQLGVRTSITANMSNKGGYIATEADNFKDLVTEVRNHLGVSTVNTANTEGYAVYQYLNPGDTSKNGTGYILITYTDNSLRSSLPSSLSLNNGASWDVVGGVKHTAAIGSGDTFSRNKAVLAYVIKVSNYKSELSGGMITTTVTEGQAKDKATADTGLSASTLSSATEFDSVALGTQDGFSINI